MIRFLDLTLLLLMAFLLQADLAIERAVGLPHGDVSSTSTSSDVFLLQVFPKSWVISEGGTEVCSDSGSEGIHGCLLQRTTSSTTVIITPIRGVQVQRLVDLLDICSPLPVQCTVGGG